MGVGEGGSVQAEKLPIALEMPPEQWPAGAPHLGSFPRSPRTHSVDHSPLCILAETRRRFCSVLWRVIMANNDEVLILCQSLSALPHVTRTALP